MYPGRARGRHSRHRNRPAPWLANSLHIFSLIYYILKINILVARIGVTSNYVVSKDSDQRGRTGSSSLSRCLGWAVGPLISPRKISHFAQPRAGQCEWPFGELVIVIAYVESYLEASEGIGKQIMAGEDGTYSNVLPISLLVLFVCLHSLSLFTLFIESMGSIRK